MKGATKRQAEVIKTIERLSSELGYPPTLLELGRELGISKSAVNYHIMALERKELVRREPRGARTLRVVS